MVELILSKDYTTAHSLGDQNLYKNKNRNEAKKIILPEDIRKPIVGSESTKKSFDLGGIGGRVRL